jgi:gliding motility-associated-like protein
MWSGPDDFTSASEDPSIPSVTDDHAGIYSLQVQVGACKSEITTKRVDVARLADFTISSNVSNSTVCTGNSVTLSVNNQANHTYQWTKDGADIGSATGTSLVANLEGSYTVKVKNTTLNCSMETTATVITVLQAPVADFSVDATACTSEDLPFTNQSQVDTRATAVNNWNFGDGFNSSDASPTHQYTTVQTFNPSLTVSYQGVGGCSDIATKSVAVVAGVEPSITASAASSCPDEEVTLSLTGAFASIAWSNAATASSIEVLPGTYSVNTMDTNGCPGNDEITIAAKEVPELTATADPPTIAAGSTSQLNASGAVSYAWFPAETLDNANVSNPVASPLNTTAYTVVGVSSENCRDSLEVIVTISGVAEFPPAFTPNGDGNHDIWDVHAETSPNCTLTIFDSRGKRVFENKGENWDGMYQGKPVPDGTYYYVYTCPDGKPMTGHVLVFK